MRNLAFAAASAQAGGFDGFGFVGMYVRCAPGGRKLEAHFEVFRRKLRHDVRDRVGLIAYEDAGTLLVELGADDVAAWVQRRIACGLASRQRTGRARESSGVGR